MATIAVLSRHVTQQLRHYDNKLQLVLDIHLSRILTATLSEDGGATEFEEPLCIEAGSVHRHGVLQGWCRWMKTQGVSVRAAGLVVSRLLTVG